MRDVQTEAGSRTAVLVCQGRAAADGRLAVGRFSDPVAARLLTPDELATVERARSDENPKGWRERVAVEWMRACAELMAPRTVVIDDAVRSAGHPQLVLLGAGLDSRPWRLTELRDRAVFLVDHPATQADAHRRSEGLVPTAGRLVLVPVDLGRGELGEALTTAGHDPGLPTTWVWEGVVPYLTADAVEATAQALAARSAPGSTLVVNYAAREWLTRAGLRVAGLLHRLTGLENPWAAEPWRSLWTPRSLAALLARCGFRVRSDEDLLAVAARIGSPTTRGRSLRSSRVAVAEREARSERRE